MIMTRNRSVVLGSPLVEAVPVVRCRVVGCRVVGCQEVR
jgi:hypothetical protein